MIFLRPDGNGANRIADLTDLFRGQTAMLLGGAPSLKEQDIDSLNQRGILTVAMNNAAVHFRPTIWISSDRPECYEPQILLDPNILKMAPIGHAGVQLGKEYGGLRYLSMPNIFFYAQTPGVDWSEYLDERNGVPWYNNTLMSSIHILYQLGIRKIILGGSDFGGSPDGDMYAHETNLGDLQEKWNISLYNSLVDELRILKSYFESKRLKFMDCSKYSRLTDTYKHLTMEEAVAECLKRFPDQMLDSTLLPHCSKFAKMDIKKAIAGWPGNAENKTATNSKLSEVVVTKNNDAVKHKKKLHTLT